MDLISEQNPLLNSLAQSRVEEEEITRETAGALDRWRASLSRGEGIPHEEILREFGLSPLVPRASLCQETAS